MALEVVTAALSEIGLGDLARVGGKGANLGHLLRGGFPVPPGFCVLAGAYESFLAQPDLARRISDILGPLELSDLTAVEEAAARIRGLFLSVPLPAPTEWAIAAAYRALLEDVGADTLVAVRSSVGTKDLSVTSFPGQMDTYHNLRGEDEVLRKVVECWASAYSYRALVNRLSRGIDHRDVFVAPLVQAMVAADSAGVIFTANPLSGRRDQMVINACPGLGEGVVAGELQCDHLVLEHDSGEVVEEALGHKDFKIVLDTERGQGNLKVPLPPEEGDLPAISPSQVRQLAEAARAIEAYYGSPQDIEWAFAAGELYILQARKITGLETAPQAEEAPPATAAVSGGAPSPAGGATEPHDDSAATPPAPSPDGAREWVSEFDTTVDPRFDLYTLSNISEVLPGVLTPLSMSDIPSLDYGFTKANSDFGLMKGIEPASEMNFLGLFYGRVHLNLSVVRAMIARAPGGSTREFDRRPPEESGLEEVKWRPTRENLFALPGIILGLLRGAREAPARAVELAHENERLLAEARRLNVANAPYPSIMEWLGESRAFVNEVMAGHIVVSELATNYYGLLTKLTAAWLEDTDGMLASRLVTGLQTLESARPNIGIWDLSRQVCASPELREVVESTPPEEVLTRLESDPSPQAAALLASLRSFLDDFGYRGVFEGEAMTLNWEEDPGYVFSMIRNYLDTGPEYDPREHARRQEREREGATAAALARLSAARRPLLRYAIRQAQEFIRLREFMKAVLVRLLAQGKAIYHALGPRFAAEGITTAADDIFFLTSTEIRELALGRGRDIAVGEVVARRRREYERNLSVVLPEHSKGRPRPLSPAELEARGEVHVLSGIPVSPGRVTGRARVITDPRRNPRFEPGEILVAPVTDAAWTPLFVTAAAIVVDVGGPLSHGSIVAREYGIPGVLNVGQGTRVIRTGQTITVDGDRGMVYIHTPEGGAGQAGAPSREPGEGEWTSEFDTTVDPAYPDYTLSNISEVLPGVLTPLTMSDLDALDYGFVKTNRDFGLMKGIEPASEMTFLGLFYGRCHLNLSVIKAIAARVPGGSASEFERRDAGVGGKAERTWRPTPANLAALPRLLWRELVRGITTPREAEALAREMDARLEEAGRRDLEHLPCRDILEGMEVGREHLFRAMAMHITVSQFALIHHLLLCRLTAAWLGDNDGMLASRLMTGLRGLESARPSALIWDLSRMVLASGELGRIFAESAPGEILSRLEGSASPEAAAFLASLRSFLAEFGYRGVFEAETMLPSWEEDPSCVFSMIANYLEADASSGPRELAARQDREREEAMREVERKLKGLRHVVFRYILGQAQRYISLREYMKSYLIKGIHQAKKTYRALGARLSEDGVLSASEDIYFLTRQEIAALAGGGGGKASWGEMIARRRAEYERNLTVTLPQYSHGRPRPLTPEELARERNVEVLEGIGVSPGVVTAKARVITDPRRDAALKPGEILVAPVTDAAWTPLFVTAAATVVEVGGPLSHGSIVAREFGMPCVVNAGGATQLIATGQTITVDGGQGKVYLHPAEK
ncbi:MAG: PEP/pyruvate-binding domain-containing protein [Actinomycetota bacterium]